MATQVITYTPESFNKKILHLHAAGDELHSRNGVDVIKTTGRALLEKYGLVSTFGICLLHRHFDLEPHEILVEWNHVSVPYQNAGYGTQTSDQIQPQAWMMTGDRGTWMPYEFGFYPNEDSEGIDISDPKYGEFLKEFEEQMTAAGLEKVVGLRKWPGDGFKGGIEFTEGRANIFLPDGAVS